MTLPSDFVLVGLTGGMGSGKSTVRRMIAESGIPTLDADQLAREVVEPGQPANADIARTWPEAIAEDGQLNRKALAKIVFADPEARKTLEGFTHPRIRERLHQRAAELASEGHSLAVYEASLLVEAGNLRDFAALVVVDAPEDVRVARSVARDGSNPEEARARIAAQFPLSEKLKVATHVIDNGGDETATRQQVDDLVIELRKRFEASNG